MRYLNLIKSIVVALLLVVGISVNAQVANDICDDAIDIGNLPNPPNCPGGGAGNTFTYNGTTNNAIAENPAPLLNCYGTTSAADVWLSFTAEGNEMTADLTSGLGDANMGLYSGACGALTGVYCDFSNNGNISTNWNGLIPGQTYYIQIMGQDPTDFSNFSLELTAINNCDICVLAAGLTATPAPTNGYYLPGTTVQFCLTVTEYDQIGNNWMSGVVPSFGASWDLGTLTGISAPNGSGTYVWVWDNGPFGWGWYVDVDPNGGQGPDGDYTNNYGDPSIDGSNLNETFCWEITTSNNCTPGGDLGISVNTLSDFETGGYGVAGCADDPDFPLSAAMICCDLPIITQIDESCSGAEDGSATVLGQGGNDPYDYVWEDGTGATIYTDNNNFGVSAFGGLAPGIYTVTVTDDDGCIQIIDITIVAGPTFTVTAAAGSSLCAGVPCSGTLTGSAVGGSGGNVYTWSGGPTPNSQNQTNVCAGAYLLTVTSGTCVDTMTAIVTAPPVLVATDLETDVSCFGGNDGNGEVTASGGTPPYNVSWTGTTSGNPGGNEINVSGGTYDLTNLAAGTYNVTVTDANGCTATTTINIADGLLVTAGFSIPPNQCLTGNSFTFTNNPTSTTGSGVTFAWDFGDGSGTSTAEDPTYSFSTANTFTVTQIVYSGGCSDTATMTVTVYPMPVPTAFADSVLCNGDATGSATVNAPAYTGYSWNSTPGQITNPATGLPAGNYTVTVTDANTCTGQVSVDVFEPVVLTATETHNNPSCNGFADGDATAQGVDGTASYTYSWNTVPVQNTQTATGLAAGTYTCTVTDLNGCTTTVDATLVDPPGMVFAPTMTPANCGLADGDANVTVTSGGTGPYTYSWNTVPVQNTQAATNILAGTYTVTITDLGTGCIQDTSITVSTTAGITADVFFISNTLCNGSADGQAYATPTGGTAPYTYSWTPGLSTNDTLTAAAGFYTVTITDFAGCTGTDTVTIFEPTPVVASITGSNNPSCANAADGDATAGGAGGTPGYTYSWNTVPVQNAQTATGLAAGTYQVTVTDLNGCTDTISVTLIDGPQLTSSVVGDSVSCFGLSDGSANLTVNGGTAPFTYNWTPSGSNAEDPTGLSAGMHYVTATSFEGCVVNDTVEIFEPTQLVIVIDSTDDVTCFGFSDGRAFSSASGGTPGYTYAWGTVPVQFTDDAILLAAGIYTVTVTDANGCQANVNATINEPPALAANTGGFAAYCGLDQGSVWANPTNGTAPYTYVWDSAAVAIANNGPSNGSDTLGGLYPGTYGVEITDANGCKLNTSAAIIAAPGGTATISGTTDVSCFNGSDGTATVSTGGAYPGFTYSWNSTPIQTTNPAVGLPQGNYTVTVTDTLGCVMISNIAVINEPTALTLSVISNAKICPSACDAVVSSSPGGGTAPYTFQWNAASGNQITQNANNLCPGISYSVTVTDSLGCTITDSITVLDPPAMIPANVVTAANCNQADGFATSSVTTNGTAPFTFEWDSAGTVIGNNATSPNVYAGTYYVTITDSLGCSVVDTVTIPNISGPTITLDSTYNVQCFGANDGYAEIQVTGGAFPYTYLWSDTAAQTTPSATNLLAGGYTVTATDSNGCVVSTAINITEPPIIQVTVGGTNPTCFTYNDGFVWANAQGGTGGTYTYQWNTNPIQNTDTAFNLVDGAYFVTAMDSNGCFDTATVILVDPLLFSVNLTTTNVSCFGVCDATAATTLTNGISPFSYSWDDPAGQSTDSIFGLCDTTAITVTVTDFMNCVATATIAITEPPLLELTEDSVNHIDVDCFGNLTGSAGVNVAGGSGAFTFLWELGGNPISVNQTATNLAAGAYLVTVTDGNGCTDQIIVTITQPAALAAVATPTDAGCAGANTGSAFVDVAAGTGAAPYSYLWTGVGSGLQTTDTAFSLIANTAPGYTVTITDSLGCIFVINNIVVDEPAALILTTDSIPSTCGLANGTASVQVGGGTNPYSYNWTTVPAQGTAIADSVVAGNYTVYVTDGNGCIDSAVAIVPDLGSPTITIPTSTNVTCQGAGDGSAQSVAVGGTAPYSYLWDTGNPADTLANVTGLDGQVYNVTVFDANGCSSGATVTINENLGVVAAITASTNVSCNGLADGTADVVAQGGTGGTYTYLWTGGAAPATANNTGLAANTYFVTVTDSNGCQANDTVIITEPAPLTVVEDSLAHLLCNGDNSGYIRILAAGGTQPYVTYAWTPNVSAGAIAGGIPAGNYSYTVTDANGCQATGNSVVTEPTPLAVDTSTISSTCGLLNGSATVTVNAGAGTAPYTYAWNTNPAQNTATATNLAASLYTVTVTDNNGCFVIQNAIVTDLPGPIIDSMIVTHVSCNGLTDGTATVYASNGALPYTYQWDANANNQVNQIATDLGASPPLYSVTVTDNNGCFSTSIAQIIEPNALQAFINAPDTICYNEDFQLFSNAGGGTQPYTQYDWTGGITQTVTTQGPFLDTLQTSTLYNVEVTDDNGCTATTQHIVYVRAQPTFTVADDVICQGQMATLTPANLAGGDPSNPFTFMWMEVDTSTTPDTYTPLGAFNPYTASPTDSTNYAIYVDNVCATSDTVYASIHVMDTAIVRILSDVRAGCPVLTVDFKADSLGGPGAIDGNSYVWDFGNTMAGTGDSTFHEYSNPGTYDVTVTVTTANGCISTFGEPAWVTVHPVPVADFTTDPNPPNVTLLNPYFEFINQSTGNDFNDWDFGDGIGTSALVDPNYTYADTGFYDVTLIVENIHGCTAEAITTVRIRPDFFIAVPNTFTPDGDGLNDIFFPGALELTGGTDRNYSFYIFNRWGELINEVHEMSEGWDGTYKGKLVQNGTYVWRIEVTDLEGIVHKYTGHVNVLR